MTQAYQSKKTADEACEGYNLNKSHQLWEDNTKPLPVHTVEGFYLVPEALYDEVIKKFVEGK